MTRLHITYNRELLSDPICSSEDAIFYLKQIWDMERINLQEQVYMLCIDNNNQVLCWHCLNTGRSNSTEVDIKLATACALGCMASKIIIAHNHPSGMLKPSDADIRLTVKLQLAIAMFEIKLLDHLILAESGYYSFKDKGLLTEAA